MNLDNDKNSHLPEKPFTLSSYGDVDKRRYHPLLTSLVATFLYGSFVLGTLMPLVLLLLAGLMYMDLVPRYALMALTTIVCLDYIIPLPVGDRPNIYFKERWDRMICEGAQMYFPGRSIFLPKQLSKDKSYILASWPHGLLAGGCHLGFYDFETHCGIYPLYSGASIMRYVPLTRRIIYTLGCVDVTKKSLMRALDVKSHGPKYPYNVVHLIVGGIHEMFYTPVGSEYEQIIVRSRKGFIKLALRTGSDIIPYYSFGANQTYARISGPKSLLCTISRRFRFSVLMWFGRWWIPMSFIPFQVPLLGVVGEVFEVPKVKESEITDELVQSVHSDFCKRLKILFDTYKVVYVEEMGADRSWLTRELKFEDE